MRVLHIWNTAGVGSVIVKYMDKTFGTHSWLLHRRVHDPYGFTTHGELLDSGVWLFTLRCLIKTRKFDVIHVHSFDKIVPYVKFLYPNKPVVLHYHGTEIRGKWDLKRNFWEKADLIFYSTVDLRESKTPETALYIPNPIDLDLFRPCCKTSERKQALHFSYNADDLAHKYADEHSIKLEIYNKGEHGIIPYSEIREFLCQYEYYIDVKRDKTGTLLNALSKTALEALACELKVINWKGDLIEGFPRENHPEHIVKMIYEKYLNLFKSL